jgi:nucleotide-binding universal stress UspA family protein
MSVRPSVLCPSDFSDASRGALRYGTAIASHFGTRLIVMTVEDPLLTEALDLGTGSSWKPEDTTRELVEFTAKTIGRDSPAGVRLEYDVAVGKPAPEILQKARDRGADLVVLSTHGLTGVRKLFFGSTTERVLRETTHPVLLTPPTDPGAVSLEDAKRIVGRILVPVDLSEASLHQAQIARGIADALNVPVIIVHVVEPVRSRLAAQLHLPGIEASRRASAEEGLSELMAALPHKTRPEGLVAYGDPAEEIAKVARDRRAGLVVMGLHGSPVLGPRMGSVTYRLICLLPTLVLALPPVPAATPSHALAKEHSSRRGE